MMKILFSYPTELNNEVQLINKIVNSGKWDKFHLRKPNWPKQEVDKLFLGLNDEVKKITIIHTNFKGSCHSFKEIEALEEKMEYCFLSPIFDSISKQGYKANFEKVALKEFLKEDRKIKVIGLGGVTENNYSELIKLGFDGGAFLGSVWTKYLVTTHLLT